MNVLVVVSSMKDWPSGFEGAELVRARDYLSDSRYASIKGARLYNLCRSYRYQSTGYYVSLLAEARGHKPFPSVTAIQDLKSQSIIRVAAEDLDDLIQRSLTRIQSGEFELSVYFGVNVAKRHTALSQSLFKLFQMPFFKAYFARSTRNRKWYLRNIGALDAGDIPEDHRQFAIDSAREFIGHRHRALRRKTYRYDIAILSNPLEKEPPSDDGALRRFVKAAEALGLAAELIGKDDYGRLAEFDALFIRETTAVNHHTYRFARRAQAEGLVVMDDPESILKCTNKVFLAELLQKHRVLTPKTVIVHRENARAVSRELEFPIILKRPDSSFSQGVVKAEDEESLLKWMDAMLEKSDLIIAQEFMPTGYDWRVGVLDRKLLFVCKYFMAGEHWQIIKRNTEGEKTEDGLAETLAVEDAPRGVIKAALRAANLISDGLYGVDVKQVGGRFYVIEVNDNPNIDHGIEDEVLGDGLYGKVMEVFLDRIEKRKAIKGP